MYPELARRRHPRVPAGFLVMAHHAGRILLRKARDVSMTGVLLEGDDVQPGDVTVEIPLPDEDFTVRARGRAVAREGGTAVHFLEMDWDDMFALARFVTPRLP